jgi:hypothetical protein
MPVVDEPRPPVPALLARPAIREPIEPGRQPIPREPERFTAIHIGNIDVEILAAPEPARPATTIAEPAVAPSPLARGFTLPIGLRQS